MWNKLHGKHARVPGKPNVFTDQNEKSFSGHLIALSAFGFPVTGEDISIIKLKGFGQLGWKMVP